MSYTVYWIHLSYMLAAILFIVGLKRLSSIKTARGGNALATLAMLLAIGATIFDLYMTQSPFQPGFLIAGSIVGSLIGAYFAFRVGMTEMPQMVALLNGMGGAASLFVALSYFFEMILKTKNEGARVPVELMLPQEAISIVLSVLIGAVTLTGSLVAYGKLQGVKWVPEKPVQFLGQHILNLFLLVGSLGLGYILVFHASFTWEQILLIVVVSLLCLALGVLLVLPIGGADMPVVISLLNSYSGLAAAMTGFIINNNLLLISGSLVGASGLILTALMCKGMNRSLTNVLFGGFGSESSVGGGKQEYKNVKRTDAEEIAMLLESAQKVIMVPGYGMAVSQAQHTFRELGQLLEERGCEVKYAIHPVAGRMPGHMNVLLAEANIPYHQLFEMDEINGEFKTADLAIILGANDVVNPAALDDPKSPIYGMPILLVHEAKRVLVIKRSLSPGFAGIHNPLFERNNTLMFFADGRQAMEDIVKEVKQL